MLSVWVMAVVGKFWPKRVRDVGQS